MVSRVTWKWESFNCASPDLFRSHFIFFPNKSMAHKKRRKKVSLTTRCQLKQIEHYQRIGVLLWTVCSAHQCWEKIEREMYRRFAVHQLAMDHRSDDGAELEVKSSRFTCQSCDLHLSPWALGIERENADTSWGWRAQSSEGTVTCCRKASPSHWKLPTEVVRWAEVTTSKWHCAKAGAYRDKQPCIPTGKSWSTCADTGRLYKNHPVKLVSYYRTKTMGANS